MNAVCNRWTPAALHWGCRLVGSSCTFEFGDDKYRYFWPLNRIARRSERAVELPIAWDRVRWTDPARTLEIGNVLSKGVILPTTLVLAVRQKSYPPPRPGRHPSENDLSPNVESST